MVRFPDWPMRLSNYLSERRKMPFEWGVNDCVMFAAHAVEALTGVNYYSDYIRTYSTKEEAAKILKELGGMSGLISKHIADSHTNIFKAKRGDLVMAKLPLHTMGVVDDGGQFAVFVTEEGLIRKPLKFVTRIWSY